MSYTENMIEYEIWQEGYNATGENDQARLRGKVKAHSFKEACNILFCREYLEGVDKHPQLDKSRFDYDPNRLTYWGCRLFDNEAEARKSFG